MTTVAVGYQCVLQYAAAGIMQPTLGTPLSPATEHPERDTTGHQYREQNESGKQPRIVADRTGGHGIQSWLAR